LSVEQQYQMIVDLRNHTQVQSLNDK